MSVPTTLTATGQPTDNANSATANTPAVVVAAGTVLAANAARKFFRIQNLSTAPLFVRYGASASSTVFHVVLAGCTVDSDGTGGILEDDAWTGVVSVASSTPKFVVTELT